MRAREFISEETKEQIERNRLMATRGVHKFTDAEKWNSDYKLYRMGLALACTDGNNVPDVDFESFVGRWKMAYPYSELEVHMLEKAYKATKTAFVDMNKGDMMSRELDDTNTVSPVANWMKK